MTVKYILLEFNRCVVLLFKERNLLKIGSYGVTRPKGGTSNVSDEPNLGTLALRLSGIADEISNLSKPGLLDVISVASPFFLDDGDDKAVQSAIAKIRSASGLGPFQAPIQKYLETCIEIDSVFTKTRCRSDRRAKRFLTLQKQLDSFLQRKITAEVLVLRIREQVLLLENMVRDPPKKKRKKPTKKRPKDEDIPEGVREFIMRKMIQALLLAIPISIFVYLITIDQYITSLAIAGSIIGLLVGTLFELLYYYANKDTSLQRFIALIVLAAYVTIFILIAGFYLEAVYLQLGYITNIVLLISLLVTELIARWGPLKHLLKIMEYIESGIILIVFFIAAQIVSLLIGESVWVTISVIAAFYTILDRQAKRADSQK